MHKLFASEGVVLAKRGAGEANSSVVILTKELGLLRASAKSARVEKSKLRYGLEPLTHGTFSFVRGKYEWKITGVVTPWVVAAGDPLRRAAAGRIARLLLRLVQGEDPAPAVFLTSLEGFRVLAQALTQEEADAAEIVTVLRVLAHLGYLPHSPALAPFIEDDFSIKLSTKALEARGLLIRTINESLQATGL